MYELTDTIVAVSSPSSEQRVIVRITGPRAFDVCKQVCRVGFSPPIESRSLQGGASPTLHSGSLALDDELEIEAQLYLFFAPHSYTGDDVAEIHIHTNRAVAEALMANLLENGL